MKLLYELQFLYGLVLELDGRVSHKLRSQCKNQCSIIDLDSAMAWLQYYCNCTTSYYCCYYMTVYICYYMTVYISTVISNDGHAFI